MTIIALQSVALGALVLSLASELFVYNEVRHSSRAIGGGLGFDSPTTYDWLGAFAQLQEEETFLSHRVRIVCSPQP